MLNQKKIIFPEDNKIDEIAHSVVKELYGIEGAFLTNESSLEDFEEIKYPGHKLFSLNKIPEKEQNHYEKEFKKHPFQMDKDRYFVWYPPVSAEEEVTNDKLLREKIARKLKKKLGISLTDYPENEPVYIWIIAKMIKQRERES